MKSVSYSLGITAGLLLSTAQIGFAQSACDDSSSPTITCDTSGAGFRDRGLDNADLTVTSSGDIEETRRGPAIHLGDDADVQVDGSVLAEDGSGIVVGADGEVTVGVNGSVSSEGTSRSDDDHAIRGLAGLIATINGFVSTLNGDGIFGLKDSEIDISDTATISSGDDGVNVGPNSKVTNAGTIEAKDEGIEVGRYSEVTNSGKITAVGNGIEGASDLRIINTSTGVIISEVMQEDERGGNGVLDVFEMRMASKRVMTCLFKTTA